MRFWRETRKSSPLTLSLSLSPPHPHTHPTHLAVEAQLLEALGLLAGGDLGGGSMREEDRESEGLERGGGRSSAPHLAGPLSFPLLPTRATHRLGRHEAGLGSHGCVCVCVCVCVCAVSRWWCGPPSRPGRARGTGGAPPRKKKVRASAAVSPSPQPSPLAFFFSSQMIRGQHTRGRALTQTHARHAHHATPPCRPRGCRAKQRTHTRRARPLSPPPAIPHQNKTKKRPPPHSHSDPSPPPPTPAHHPTAPPTQTPGSHPSPLSSTPPRCTSWPAPAG